MDDILNSPGMKMMRKVDAQIEDSPTDWRGDLSGNGELETNKSISVLGLGHYGMISLTGKITREADKYKCFVQAVCLPYANDSTEIVDSLEAAKKNIVQQMHSLAGIIALINMTHQGQSLE